MAKVEHHCVAARGDQRGFAVPGFLPRKANPNIGWSRVDGERFILREFMELEWTHLFHQIIDQCLMGDFPWQGMRAHAPGGRAGG